MATKDDFGRSIAVFTGHFSKLQQHQVFALCSHDNGIVK